MIEICISDTSPTTVWVMHLICFTEMHHHYKVKQEQKYFQWLWLWRTKVNGNYRQQCYKFPKSCHVEMHKGICGTLMFFWVQTMKILNVLFEIQLLKLTADNRHFVWSGHTLSQEMVITLHSLHNCSSKSHAPRTVGSSLKFQLTDEVQECGYSLQHCVCHFGWGLVQLPDLPHQTQQKGWTHGIALPLKEQLALCFYSGEQGCWTTVQAPTGTLKACLSKFTGSGTAWMKLSKILSHRWRHPTGSPEIYLLFFPLTKLLCFREFVTI